mmetsp:Transcript_3674/g.7633  ORF Transcript_3674/g.7633 Transcript_3674/m.7633 type:complete len:408 (-) Transcript_3674:676-1899(-)
MEEEEQRRENKKYRWSVSGSGSSFSLPSVAITVADVTTRSFLLLVAFHDKGRLHRRLGPSVGGRRELVVPQGGQSRVRGQQRREGLAREELAQEVQRRLRPVLRDHVPRAVERDELQALGVVRHLPPELGAQVLSHQVGAEVRRLARQHRQAGRGVVVEPRPVGPAVQLLQPDLLDRQPRALVADARVAVAVVDPGALQLWHDLPVDVDHRGALQHNLLVPVAGVVLRQVVEAHAGVGPGRGGRVVHVHGLTDVRPRHVLPHLLVRGRDHRGEQRVVVHVQVLPGLGQPVRGAHDVLPEGQRALLRGAPPPQARRVAPQGHLVVQLLGAAPALRGVREGAQLPVRRVRHAVGAPAGHQVRQPHLALVPQQVVDLVVDEPVLVGVPQRVHGLGLRSVVGARIPDRNAL